MLTSDVLLDDLLKTIVVYTTHKVLYHIETSCVCYFCFNFNIFSGINIEIPLKH